MVLYSEVMESGCGGCYKLWSQGMVFVRAHKGETYHTKVQILFDPLLAVLELLVQTHDVEGVQRIHDGGP